MTNNDNEIELLKSNPNALIVKYQDIIKIIVNKFISSGSINFSDKEEFFQIINERLLLSSKRIKKQYKGISLLKTYYSTIIRNICLEEINKRKRYNFSELETSNYIELSENAIYEDFYLNYEFDRLSKILDMYNSKTPKLVLCLKIIYRLPVEVNDFKKYCLKLKVDKINELIEVVNPVKIISEFELFQILTPYINKCDNQNNQPDALRRWTKRKIDEIIELMNGDPPRANYDKETLQILIEKFYSKKMNKIVQN